MPKHVAGERPISLPDSQPDQLRKRGRPRSEEAERAILDATMELLASEGYFGFTVNKVAAHARVSKATIYRRWPSKEHLILAAFDQMPSLLPIDKGGLVEDLVYVLMRYINIIRTSPLVEALPNLLGALSRNPALAQVMGGWMEDRRIGVKEIVARAITRGELPATLDIDIAVDMVMGPVNLRLFFYPKADLSRMAVRELVTRAARGMTD